MSLTYPAVKSYLEPAFQARVRLRARRYTAWMRFLWAADAGEPGQGLAITHDEVDQALSDRFAPAEAEFYANNGRGQLEQSIREADAHAALDPTWGRLRREFGLTQPEIDLLSLLVAAEADPTLWRVYGYLHDDVRACHVTPWLAARLFEWETGEGVGPESALVRWRLAWPVEGAGNPWALTSQWVVDPHIVAWICRGPRYDPTLGSVVQVVSRQDVEGLECLYPEQLAAMRAYTEALRPDLLDSGPAIELEVVGPHGSGRRILAAQLCATLGADLLTADAAVLMGPDVPSNLAIEHGLRVMRLARLWDAVVYWDNAESVTASTWRALSPSGLTIFGASVRLTPRADGVARRAYRLPDLKRAARAALWERLTHQPMPAPISDWTLTPAEIVTAARSAAAGPQAVVESCRQMLYQAPGELFTPLACPYTWEDIVLTPSVRQHLQELEAQARLRGAVFEEWGFDKLFPLGRGLTAMFAGPSGTGKTMAAQVLARALGIELYRVDLAGVMNKYIGETEKRLKQVFDACERANVLLFFDEADALFGQRTQVRDAHDRFANIEIDYLLQRMEQFDGIAILATNRKSDVDRAFLRRLRFIVDFLQPGPVERRQLWRLALLPRSPDGRDLLDAIDWDFLAEKLPLTGADIKIAALGAAFLARSAGTRIGMSHVLAAARRELAKHGTVLRAGDWES